MKTPSLVVSRLIRACAIASLAGLPISALGQAEAPAKPAPATRTQPESAKPTLGVGDAAPALSVEKWVKGAEVTGFEKDKVYVVEFWATWCGPCVASMPHLSKLQKQYKDQGLTIIGVTSKDPNNTLDAVEKMVMDKGDTMGYSVAWDNEARATSMSYMKASGQRGIPCSFVVDKLGKLAYIGHPSQLDLVLPGVLAGTWDAKSGREMLATISSEQREIGKLSRTEPGEAVKKLDALAAKYPSIGESMLEEKYQWQLAAGDKAGAFATGTMIVNEAVAHKDAQLLNSLAWGIVDPKSKLKIKDVDFALSTAIKADELAGGKDPGIIDTLARAYFLKGNVAKAIELQEKAVGMAEGDMKAELQSPLDEYRKSGN